MDKAYIYLFDDMDNLSDNFASENLHSIPAFRRKQCAKYRQKSDRAACVLAYLLLKKGLREQYGLMHSPEFIYSEHGKPYLRETPHIFFNFSHCKHGVVCALADFEIGVDIQDIQPFNGDTARLVCSEAELIQLNESDNPSKLFCMIWAKKESYAKANGISISNILGHDFQDEGFFKFEHTAYCISTFTTNTVIQQIDYRACSEGILQ